MRGYPESLTRGPRHERSTRSGCGCTLVSPARPLPDFLHPDLMPVSTEPVRTVVVSQVADRIVARPIEAGPHSGSPLGLIRTRNGRIKIDGLDDFWEGGGARLGRRLGPRFFRAWVILRVGDVTQRLRWIPPGKFWMGSPEDEEGRYPDEGPRHEETIPSGFWMFDTPCTQALWEAVMGENPSGFKGPDRPVESVSWDQCQEFLKRLNARCTGLELKLPSEAQWEYACRAGTETPRYREDLNEIAWYPENSQGETHPVGQKVPNDWGLYDTLGNVLEWCEDVWTEDYEARKSAAASAHRVIRGGSWLDFAQDVRAAYRFRRGPSARGNRLGFRCAEFRAPGPVGRKENRERSERGARRSGCGAPRRPRPGERSGLDQSRRARNGRRVVRDADAGAREFGRRASRAPHDDAPQVGFGHRSRQVWALGGVHDRGESREAARETRAKKKSAPPKVPLGPVRQRLRWIPPGRFLMGSPDDEEGRYSAKDRNTRSRSPKASGCSIRLAPRRSGKR